MKQKSNLARCYVVSLSKIDAVEEYVSSLIQNKQENEFVDFKQFYYHEDKKYDLIKDIVSFSNEVTSVDKYIVFGIINGSWEPAGIDLSTMPDVSVINDLLHTYVEPFIYVEIGQMKYNGKDLGFNVTDHSRNGVFVNGVRIPYNVPTYVSGKSIVALADGANKFQLIEAADEDDRSPALGADNEE